MGGLFSMDHWWEVFQTLGRNRLRTALTAFGVFWGVMMLVVMLGFGRGLENGATSSFGTWAFNTVFVFGGVTSKPYAGRQPGRMVGFTLDDVAAVADVSGVELAVPRNFLGGRWAGNKVTRKDKSESFSVSGEIPAYRRLETLDIERGRFIDPPDESEARRICVIGVRVRDLLFEAGEDPIGQSIDVGGSALTVVGVYRSPGNSGHADWLQGRVFMPRSTFARLNHSANRVDGIALLVRADRDSIDVESAVKAMLKRRKSVHPDDPQAFGGFNRAREFKKVQDLFSAIGALTWFVGVLTLAAGAIGVSNIMMIAVAERTREIGIRKAIGATPASIVIQVVTEAVVLTALAGYLGLCVGVGIVEAAGRIVAAMPAGTGHGPSFFASPEIDLGHTIAATVVLTVAGALAGLMPARAAVAIRPIEALAHE